VKITWVVSAGLLLGSVCECLAAAPPLDRPTPPPCCADGQAFANPAAFGVFPTRWRRWPLEVVQTAPMQKPSALPGPASRELPPFERPPIEEEDKKAPAPTTPAIEKAPTPMPTTGTRTPTGTTPTPTLPTNTPPGMQQRTAPGYPNPSTGVTPQTAPLVPPNLQGTPSGPATPGTPTFQPGQPIGNPYKTPGATLNRPAPKSDDDADPAPSPPFSPASIAPREPLRSDDQPPELPLPGPIAAPTQAPSNDPPPAPPGTLASAEN
jgi:hypothetical protein